MARVKVAVPEEDLSVSARAARLLGETEDTPKVTHDKKRQRMYKPSPRTMVTITIGCVLLILVILIIMLTRDRNQLQKKVDETAKSSQQIPQDEATTLAAQIGQYFELPTDETPTLVTIADADKVKSEAFFKNAQNGDKVLLYGKSGKAILYRPSTKKVIEVATINPTAPVTQP